MTLRSAAVVVATLQAAVVTAQPARGTRALNPAYLSEMPPVDRVLREIRADDPQETAARQLGAFFHFSRMIADMSGGRRDLTPDEERIRQGYRAARDAILQTRKENIVSALRGYDTNSKFKEDLLNRFFSPAFRAQYASVTAATNARIQDPGNAPVAANVPPPAAPATRPAPPKTPAAPRAPDPSIVKARAANVDTKVFGIPLGEPLTLPVCAQNGIFDFSRPPTTCLSKSGLEDLAAALVGAVIGGDPSELSNLVTIQLASSSCPTWIPDCTATGTLNDGLLVAVSMSTAGPQVEAAVGKELRGKYGQRANMQQRFITPNNGSRQFEVWDLDWELPGLHVEYKVVDQAITAGLVRIETEALYQLRKSQLKEAAKPKL